MVALVAVSALGINAFRPIRTSIVDVKLGSGPAVKAGDRVVVHYVGKLANGTIFDSSKPRGSPFEVVLGRGSLIKGWELGLQGMQAGGVRRLSIPPGEAYGAKGSPPAIPPDSTLAYEVELIAIK